MNEIVVKEDTKIENMIFEVRGKQVILDSDVAILFGYQTKDLNRNVTALGKIFNKEDVATKELENIENKIAELNKVVKEKGMDSLTVMVNEGVYIFSWNSS